MRKDRPQWVERVSPRWIKRLYSAEGRGILDETLIDEVGYAMLVRCQSILQVTEAHNQRKVLCPLCDTLLGHNWEDDDLLQCDDCNWALSWGDYRKSYRKKQLHAGGMEPFLKAFVADFSKARNPKDKMILIDTLLHRYHGEYEGTAGRPGATNLIAVKNQKEVTAFLDELGGKSLAPDEAQRWVEKVRREEEPGGQMR